MDYLKLKELYNSQTKFGKILRKIKKQSQRKLNQMLLDSIADGDIVLFEFLLDHGASVDACNNHNETAVMYTCHYNQEDMLEMLLKRGAKLNRTPSIPFSFIMDDANQIIVTSLFGNDLRYANRTNRKHLCAGVNELMYAASSRFYGDTSGIIQKLIDTKQFDINAQDADGFTALMYAVEAGDYQSARVLIKNGADVNIKDKYGNTALMHSLNRIYSKYMVKLLVINGADFTIKNNFGESAEDMAKRNEKRMGVKWLDQAKAFKEIYKGRPTGLKVTKEETEREK